jgi:hypothetical protein
MPAFLQQLRSQKVESIIHLRLDKKKETDPCVKLADCLAKIIAALKSQCFRRILKSVKI